MHDSVWVTPHHFWLCLPLRMHRYKKNIWLSVSTISDHKGLNVFAWVQELAQALVPKAVTSPPPVSARSSNFLLQQVGFKCGDWSPNYRKTARTFPQIFCTSLFSERVNNIYMVQDISEDCFLVILLNTLWFIFQILLIIGKTISVHY